MLPQKAMSMSVVLLWPGVDCAATENHINVCGLRHNQKPCLCLRAMLLLGSSSMWVASAATWGHGDVHGLC